MGTHWTLFLGCSLAFVAFCAAEPEWLLDRDYPCWSKREKYHYKGLTQRPYYTLESCLRHCVATKGCKVVDYDPGTNPPCWIQPEGLIVDLKNKMKNHPRVHNYLLDRPCLEVRLVPYSSDMCWSQKTGFKVEGLVAVKDVVSVGGCLNHCAELQSCDVVQYNPYNKESVCWVQDKEFIDEGSFSASEDSFDAVYLLNRECMALYEDHQVYNPELCWKVSRGRRFKHSKQVDAADVVDCMTKCINKNCEMIDFNPYMDKPCFLKLGKEEVNDGNFELSSSNINYVLDSKCFK